MAQQYIIGLLILVALASSQVYVQWPISLHEVIYIYTIASRVRIGPERTGTAFRFFF